MKCRYIAIEREYGSGGTGIARALAVRMGIPCYGREILEEVSRGQNISVEQIERYEETVTNSFLYSVYMLAQTAAGKGDMLTADGHIYVKEQAVIRQLAANGSAIFLGHCAAEALKDHKGVVRVFIRCCDEEERRRRIVEEYGIPEGKAEAVRRKFDKKRANYYYANTVKKWDDMKNYDLVLDSGKLGEDICVKILCTLLP
ncbi:MAG: cytidylate kinase-like family protein [Lachnospiraceae bacterium]|nr:cytidylate kinase-like family protein [Lachnospiraceae bacterium]